MRILHISAECYPAAKAGGLGDVAGALPKYLNLLDLETSVVIPKYSTKWIVAQEYEEVFHGHAKLGPEFIPFTVEKLKSDELGFPLFVVNIPGKFDRPGVYADPKTGPYGDELQRALSFQHAVLLWILSLEDKPNLIHCHDHHTGLIPFLVRYAFEFNSLAKIPTVFTIHNGEYHGAFSWDNRGLLPYYDEQASGLLDWNNSINPLASAIRCCWKLTTVSPNYMIELQASSNGLEGLLTEERYKSVGILNGIDNQVWNPATDKYIEHHYNGDLGKYKYDNKKALCDKYGLDPDRPLITFIGRLVKEKGADLIPDMIYHFIRYGHEASFIILGTGEPYLHQILQSMTAQFPEYFQAVLAYDEGLAHQLYAGADYILMPSRVEPCGLNQLYALRYGTLPIVRTVGGLKDTITDIGEENGSGIRFDLFTVEDAAWALFRAINLYKKQDEFRAYRDHAIELDYSWERSAETYQELYQSLVTIKS